MNISLRQILAGIILPLIIPLASFAQSKVYGRSGAVKIAREKITVVPAGIMAEPSSLGVIAALAPTVIKSAVSVSKYVLTERESKYSSDYNTFYGDDNFYLATKKLNLQNLHINRSFSESENSEWKDGIDFTLMVESNKEKTAFRFALSQLKLDYSKAKARKSDVIDIHIDITFSAVEEIKGELKVSEIAQSAITFKAARLNTSYNNLQTLYYSNWFPVPNMAIDVSVIPPGKLIPNKIAMADSAGRYGLSTDEILKSNWLMDENRRAVKFTKIDNDNFLRLQGEFQSGGSYGVTVTIKEANPRVLKTMKLHRFFDENGSSLDELTEKLTSFLSEGKE